MVAICSRRPHRRDHPRSADAPDALLGRQGRQDHDAFAALYLRYVEEISRFCYHRLGDEEAARDAAQQSFAQAWAGFPRYHEVGQVRAWLYTITRRVLANHLRSQRMTVPLEAASEALDPGASPDELTALAWERRAIREAVARLPADQRTAVELRMAGLTGREVAEVLGRSHDAVKKLQLRALERLRRELDSPLRGPETDHGA